MKTISMVDLRTQSQKIMKDLARGEKIQLEYRGKPVAILQPIHENEEEGEKDPIREIGLLAETGMGSLGQFSIDELLYGENSDVH